MSEIQQPSEFEKRQFDRHKVVLNVSVWLEDGTDCVENVNKTALSTSRNACVEDLSVSGLCFISTEAFPLQGIVGVRLRLGTKTFDLEAVVRRRYMTQLTGMRCFGCGVQFLRTAQAPQAIVAIARYLKALKVPLNDVPYRGQDAPALAAAAAAALSELGA